MKFSLAILSAVLLVTNNVVITTANEVDDLIESEQEIIAKLNGLQMKSHLDTTTTTTTKAAAAQEDTHETKRQFHKEEKKLAKAQKLNEEMNLLASTIVDADGSNDDEVVGTHSHHHIEAKADKNTFTIEDNTIKVAKTSKAKVESTSKASKATKAAKAHGDSIVLAADVHSLSMSHSMSMAEVSSTSTTSDSTTSLHAKATKATKDLTAKASKTTTSETTTTTNIANTTQALSLSYNEVAATEDTLASKSAKATAETKPTKPVIIEYTEKPETEEVVEEDSSASDEVPEVEVVDVDEEEEEEDTKSTSDEDEEKEEDSEQEDEEEGSEDSDSDESEQVTRGSDPKLIKEVQSVMLNGIAANNHMNKPETMNPRTELNGKVMAAVDLSSDSSTIRGASGMIVGGVCLFVSSIVYAMII
ncbi:hypothetical protein ACHAXH_000609 [Discostella pseudostelligera]